MKNPIAFMPLPTYAESISDGAITSAIAFGAGLGCKVHVCAYAAEMPQIYSPMGDVAFDLQRLIDSAREASKTEAARLEAALTAAKSPATFRYDETLGAWHQMAASQARLHDLVLMPWQKDAVSIHALTESMVFGAGRPTLVVPPTAKPAEIKHLAVAWNNSQVAARALNDALGYLAKGGKVSVLGLGDYAANAADLAKALVQRGYDAAPRSVSGEDKSIAQALQDSAQAAGADLLAMGGFGHSRLRDFVLGGATKGVFADMILPVMLSH